MREIKFRAWDNNLKTMINVFTLYNEGTGSVIPQTDPHSSTTGSERYKVMQFTGLLDKHGKEIYEGDILKQNLGRREIIGVMFFNEQQAQFGFNAEIESEKKIPENIVIKSKPEIIGNIYENPDLI